jgi:hypothetical protein
MVSFPKVNQLTNWNLPGNVNDPFYLPQERTVISSEQREKIFRATLQSFFLERENQLLIQQQNALMGACITSLHAIVPHQREQTFLLQRTRDNYRQLNGRMQELISMYKLELQRRESFNQETAQIFADLSQRLDRVRKKSEDYKASQANQMQQIPVLEEKDIKSKIEQVREETQTLIQLRSDTAEIRVGFDDITGNSRSGGMKQIRDAVYVLQKDVQEVKVKMGDLEEVQEEQELELQKLAKDSEEKQAAIANLRKLMEEIDQEEDDSDLQDLEFSDDAIESPGESLSLEPLANVPASKPLVPLFGWLLGNWNFFGSLIKTYQFYQIGVVRTHSLTELAKTWKGSNVL